MRKICTRERERGWGWGWRRVKRDTERRKEEDRNTGKREKAR